MYMCVCAKFDDFKLGGCEVNLRSYGIEDMLYFILLYCALQNINVMSGERDGGRGNP